MSTVEEHFAILQAVKAEKGWLSDRFHYSAAIFLGAHLDELEAAWKAALAASPPDRGELRKALKDLLIAVTYAAPAKDYGQPDDPNPCYEARVPVAFVQRAEAALAASPPVSPGEIEASPPEVQRPPTESGLSGQAAKVDGSTGGPR